MNISFKLRIYYGTSWTKWFWKNHINKNDSGLIKADRGEIKLFDKSF